MEGVVQGELLGQRVEQVEQPHVDRLDLPGPMISQDVVDLLEGLRYKAARLTVRDRGGLRGVGVIEIQGPVGEQRLRGSETGEPGEEGVGQRGRAHPQEPTPVQGQES